MSNKPPTQGVGVEGFRADVYAADEVKVDWMKLIQSPKYQWFASEECGVTSSNVMAWITEFTRQQIEQKGEKAFFDLYCAWHNNKAHWKNEDVYGELLGES